MYKMLVPPDYGIVKMVSIDPGLNTCGISIYELNTLTHEIVSISAFTIETEKLTDSSGLYTDIVSERFIKIYKLCNCIASIVSATGAKIVVSEAPFYNRFMPMAYGALLEVVSSIQHAIIALDNSIVFTSYAPQQVKMSVGAAGKKGKDIVKTSIEKVSQIFDKIISDYELLDEHSIDAIAVGFTFLEMRSGKNVWK